MKNNFIKIAAAIFLAFSLNSGTMASFDDYERCIKNTATGTDEQRAEECRSQHMLR